jgi:acyl-CoA thioesterase-1
MGTISIITDSLAMPRVEGDEVIYIKDTWPKLLNNKLLNKEYVVADFSARARDTDSFNTSNVYTESVYFTNPNIVIIQVGIVDCAPRVISKKEHSLLNRHYFPNFLKNYIIKSRKDRREAILSKGSLKKVYVQPTMFQENYSNFLSKIGKYNDEIEIIIIPILGDLDVLESKSIGYSQNINIYNNILKNVSDIHSCHYLYDLVNIMNDKKCYTKDGYHLSVLGHSRFSDTLYEYLIKHIMTC